VEVFAGSRVLRVRDELGDESFPVWVLYPTRVASIAVTLGPYSVDVSPDAPIDGGRFPLVVISHGSGGSHLLYRTFASYLARNGYIVAMPEHPGNNRNCNDREGTLANLVGRPRHIRLTLDGVCADKQLGQAVQADKVAIIGHSLGGYTALAVAGGTPLDTRQAAS